MPLIRSGQKNLDEIQRIRIAMEGKNPVITEAQRELINKYATLLGEDGKAMIEVIEQEAKKPNKLPADVFRLIEGCLQSVSQRAKKQDLSNEVMRQREPERLVQVEAIREHVTRLTGARARGDNAAAESIRQATLALVEDFMEAVDKDRDEGLDPDTARTWNDQAHEIAAQAKLDQLPEDNDGGNAGPSVPAETTNRLARLKTAIKLATHTMEVVAGKLRDPDETTLRGLGRQLGSSKKEIMALSRSLVLDQSAGVAMEASWLVNEACEAIKASRESMRVALRELGAASDISEASAPIGTRGPPLTRPVVENTDPGGDLRVGPAIDHGEANCGKHKSGMDIGGLTCGLRMASRPHASHLSMAPNGVPAKAQDKGSRRGAVSSHEGHDERSGK
jgi:hypothetical protein